MAQVRTDNMAPMFCASVPPAGDRWGPWIADRKKAHRRTGENMKDRKSNIARIKSPNAITRKRLSSAEYYFTVRSQTTNLISNKTGTGTGTDSANDDY